MTALPATRPGPALAAVERFLLLLHVLRDGSPPLAGPGPISHEERILRDYEALAFWAAERQGRRAA